MNFVEYGRRNKRVVILLHGGGLCWWSFRDVAQLLQDEYHVILPILDGHAGSDRPFVSIEENARELVAYIHERWNEPIFLLGGLSLGAQVVIEALSQKGDLCEHAIVESALVKPMRITHMLAGAGVAISYGLIQKPWFSKAQFKSLRLPERLFEEYYRDSCRISQDSLAALLRANAGFSLPAQLASCNARVLVTAGSRERPVMRRSARLLAERLPHARLEILAGFRHGEFSVWHAAEYAEAVEGLLSGQP